MDRLQALSVFVAVAEEGGFARAARRLNLSAPSVTRAVADIEARLGARLFYRTTRSVSLTEAGVRYLADCRRILADLDEADRQAAGIHAAPSGRVSVTASIMFGRTILVPVLLDLLDRYEEIALSTLFVDRVTHLVEEGIDVAVRIAELPDSSLTAIRVGSVRRVLCASPDYLARHGRPEMPPDLVGHEIIEFSAMSGGAEWRFSKAGKISNIRPRSRLRLDTGDAAIAAALGGYGITRALSYMVAPQVRSGALEIVLADYEPPAVPVHVLHKEAGQTSARVRAVVDHLVRSLRGHAALDR